MNNFKTGKKFLALVMALLIAFSGVSVYATETEGNDDEVTTYHEHRYGDWIISVKPTCQTEGEKYRECITCNDGKETQKIPVEPNAHVHGAETIIKEATCAYTGISEFTCKVENCGVKYQVETAALGHSFELDDNGEEIITITKEPEHMYMHYIDGEGYSTCVRCRLSIDRVIYVEHNFDGATPDIMRAATCSSLGYKETTCNVCRYPISENLPIDPKAHVFSGKAQLKDGEFSCKVDGEGVIICEKCYVTDEVIIPKETYHDYLEWETSVEIPVGASCLSGFIGEEHRFCKTCNTEIERRNLYPHHNFIEYDEDGKEISHVIGKVAATCTEKGYEIGNCVDCNKKGVTNYYDIEVNAHKYIEKVVDEPSCVKEGKLLRVCKDDASHFEYIKIDMVDHIYDGKWEIKEATCLMPGYKKNHCAVCDDIINIEIEIDEDAHDFTGQRWDDFVRASCGNTGKEKARCNICKKDIERDIPMCYSEGINFKTVAATCYKEGKTTYLCKRCGVSYEIIIPKDSTVHTPSVSHIERKKATCEETGLETKYCIYCKVDITEEQKIIPLQAHIVKEIVTELPDCKTNTRGKKHYECVNCGDKSDEYYIDFEHSFEAWKWSVDTEPNCVKPVTVERRCYACGFVDTKDDYYGNHKAAEWTDINGNKINCEVGGVAYKICVDCGEEYDRLTFAPGEHKDINYVRDNITVSATECYGKVYFCNVCSEEIVINGIHNFIVVDKGYEPTCTTEGRTDSRYCATCKIKIEQQILSPLGHDYEYNSSGTKYCTRCYQYFIDGVIEGVDTCNHFCHNKGIVAKVLKAISAFFWKLFKTNHFCKCGAAHYHEEESTITLKGENKKGQLVCEYSCTECEVKNEEIVLK